MKAKIEKDGHRVTVNWGNCDRATWGRLKDEVKASGARFRPSDKVWTAPLDLETCRRMRRIFGTALEIGPELWAWAEEERKRESNLTALTDVSKIDLLEVVDLPNVRAKAPTMWAAMQQRPYQPVAAKYMAEATRCINADQPGIGKTIETLAALVERGVTGPVLVLAPKTSCTVVWETEIPKWYGDDVPYTITQMAGLTPGQRDAAWMMFEQHISKDPDDYIHFLIANAEQAGIKKFTECPAGICDGDEDWCPELAQHRNKSEMRRPFLHSIGWAAIIADETHKWLINTRGKSASQVGYGFTRLKSSGDDSPRYALSGTPLKGKKWNLFGTLNWLWPKTYSSKWNWIGNYFEVVDTTIDAGRKGIIETKEITGKWKSMQDKDAFYRSLQMVMIRRTKDELRAVNPGWMPPEKRYHDVYVKMEGSQRSHYRAMEKAAEAILKGGRLTATGVLAEMTRLKQFSNSDGELVKGEFRPTLPSSKFNWLMQFLEERGIEAGGDLSEDVHKVVVASQFTSLIKLWANALEEKGIRCAMVTGEVKGKDREQVVRDFQEDPTLRVVLINTNAGGVSITLDAADDMVIMDETWVPDDQEQVEDRVHRASNVKHQVDVWYVRTEDTIEAEIAQANYTKAESNHVVLDAPRGLRFASERFGVQIEKEES